MRRPFQGIFLLLIFYSFVGCTGKTANINPALLPAPNYDFKASATASFRVGQGSQNYFEGGPSTFSGSALKARVDLKQSQEVAAQKILSNLFDSVSETNYLQGINIISTISNFSYRLPFEIKMKPRMMVSFVMSLSAMDKDDNQIYSNTVTVEDYLGSYGEEVIGLSAGFWPLMQRDADKVSQLVGDTVLEKIYEIYSVEFEKIAEKYLKEK